MSGERRIDPDGLPEDADLLRDLVRDEHPADLAERMGRVDDEAALALFRALDGEQRAEVLPELSEAGREAILQNLTQHELVPLLGEMESDDAADLVQELRDLDEARAETLLAGLDEELRADLESLLVYPGDSAGGVMAREFVAVRRDLSVEEAIAEVRRVASEHEIEDIYSLFVVDGEGRLTGFVSLQEILLAQGGQLVSEIMHEDVVSVPALLDQEEVAAIARKYDLASVPVVDAEGRLVGRVTMDDLYDIALEEAAEDLSRLAGTDEAVHERSSFVVVRERAPWLLVGLAGGLLNAVVMSRFVADLQALLQASFFVPVVMGMGGNVANQSATIVVRGLATGELVVSDLLGRLWRESKVGLMLGLACSTALLLVVWLWLGSAQTAGVIALALGVVILQATVVGAVVPLLLKRAGIDPALATSTLLSTTNDILGLSVYLLLISLLLI
jgi:magnesium transporter